MLSQREPGRQHPEDDPGLSVTFQPVTFFAFWLCPIEKITDFHILLVRCKLIVLLPLPVLGLGWSAGEKTPSCKELGGKKGAQLTSFSWEGGSTSPGKFQQPRQCPCGQRGHCCRASTALPFCEANWGEPCANQLQPHGPSWFSLSTSSWFTGHTYSKFKPTLTSASSSNCLYFEAWRLLLS